MLPCLCSSSSVARTASRQSRCWDRRTPAFIRRVPAAVRETAQALADELVDVAFHRLTGASHFGELRHYLRRLLHG